MGFPVVSSVMKKVFGTRNDRMVKNYLRIVDQVSAYEPSIRILTDAELRAKSDEFRVRLKDGASPTSILPEVFAVAREAMDRAVGIREVFNPERKFDPSQLPTEARQAYLQTKATMDATPARAPDGDLLGSTKPVAAWQFLDIPNVIYEAVRELYPQSKPPFRARPFDVQIIGAIVLYDGRIAEMKTGEGKTIVAPLATYLSVLAGNQVHVVTVNDYLVQRDRDWTFPFFRSLGLTVGAIHPYHMQGPREKAEAYRCNVVYGTTSEFGFDYLRDNMKLSTAEQIQKHRDFAIVDEVDSTLIDEARTPLIISGPAHAHKPRYDMADRLARHLLERQRDWDAADQKVKSCMVRVSTIEGDIRNARDKAKVPDMKSQLDEARAQLPQLEGERDRFTQYYEVELDKKKATLTHAGIAEAQRVAGVGSFYVGENIDLPHLMEQAIRAHTVYQRDRDYVVAPDEEGQQSIVIVDQNTGRKMPGRQWSDGLHQAIEAKEGVPIKDETQTMATITIQNFFKLYKKRAGMTGTADTEATEFYEIYKLDVIVIPTNVPVARIDHNDLVFIAMKDKWDAVVDEIKRFHDAGRPVLVGTTSVEKSEILSQALTKRYNINHEVLNAKQHEREAEIVAGAGELGAVMIATNMAGRGTDIKLGRCSPQQLIEHWKRRSICPREVTPDMPEDAIVAAVYRHIAPKELDLKKSELEGKSDDDIRHLLLQHWARKYTWLNESKIDSASDDELRSALDQTGTSLMHRLRLFGSVADMGGLHVVGTERHESRRIDNQLRGRSGRQGDLGSSRFFLSLEDDLMKMFAGETTLRVLSRLGMKEGDAIEHPMLTKAVGRAQRKVEERNFLHRKNLLEWDELLNVQRGIFYSMRQNVLEGLGVKEMIFDHIGESVRDAVYRYLDKAYVANCIGEWVRANLNINIDSERFRGKDREDLFLLININAKQEARHMIEVTIGEYMPTDIDLGKGTIERADASMWNLAGLVDWANSNFDAQMRLADLQDKSPDEVVPLLQDAAEKMIDTKDLAPLDQFLVRDYGPRELCKWAKNKFDAELEPSQFVGLENLDSAVDTLMSTAQEVYARREIVYPIEFALEATAAMLQQDPQAAIEQFTRWVKYRYELEWNPASLPSTKPAELREILINEAKKWDDARIRERAERAAASSTTPEALNDWFVMNCGARLRDEQLNQAKDDPKSVAEERLREVLRTELTQFERWVLLQIIDQAWKDHLHAVDQLRESIGFRSFSQRDPRIEFKREGSVLFDEMHESIRDKVTDLIFKAKLTAAPVQRPPAARSTTQPPESSPHPSPATARTASPGRAPMATTAQAATAAAAAAASAALGTPEQRRALEAAERAGATTAERPKPKPRQATLTVGRNEPCPCGSGKKFKQCCGKQM